MTERIEQLYERARSLPADDRAALLDDACRDDPALRGVLSSMLHDAEAAERFFDLLGAAVRSPSAFLDAESQHAASREPELGLSPRCRSDPLVGRVIAHYRILSRLGSGGMGMVYRAHDSRLERDVALKFLPPHPDAESSAEERLVVEARAAARLQHPNVCVVHEIGETDDGRPFIAMAFYDGETLKERLRRGPLPVKEAATIAIQIARGLQAAHARGIIHRDVKPGNIMLTPNDGVKLLDFGLARIPDVTLTGPGTTLGTIAYMSPEQVRGDSIDHRTDIWSSGVVLYEMLTGSRPFPGVSDRVILQKILHSEPEPIAAQLDVPDALKRIVDCLLRKNPDERYRSADDLVVDLESAVSSGGPPAIFGSGARFPKRTRRAITLGSATTVVILAAGALWLGLRHDLSAGSASAAPPARLRILVADFANYTSDSLIADAVSHVLRTDLAQSSSVRIAGPALIATTLQHMGRERTVRLTSELAREVAVRDGIRGLIDGEVREAGGGYVISASMVEVATGEVVDGWRQTARSRDSVIPAIESISTAIRKRVGERVASLREPEHLSHLTTTSLDALRLFSRAQQLYFAGNASAAATLLEEATRIDPKFAQADELLAQSLSEMGGSRSRSLRAIVRGYQVRDRLSPPERYAIAAVYDRDVLGDLPQAVGALRNQIDASRAGGDFFLYSALGRLLAREGDLPAAESVLREALTVWPTPASQVALVMVLHQRGNDSAATTVLREAMARYPAHPGLLTLAAELSMASGHYGEADSVASALPPRARIATAHRIYAINSALQGRLGDAIGHLRAMRQDQLAAKASEPAAEVSIAIGELQLVQQDRHAAIAEVETFFLHHPVESLDVLDRPYLSLARFFAEAGRPARAVEVLKAYDKEMPREFRGSDAWSYARARAAIHVAEGKPLAALEDLDSIGRVAPNPRSRFDDHFLPLVARPELARALDRAGRADSAIATYERYLAATTADRVVVDAFELPNALVRLAELYEARGNRGAAARTYLRFVELWKNADANLQPRVERARRQAAALTRADSQKR